MIVTYTSHLTSHSRSDSVIACVVTIAMHLAFLFLLFSKGTAGGWSTAHIGGGESPFVVDFIALSPSRGQHTTAAHEATPSASKALDSTPPLDPVGPDAQPSASQAVVVPQADDQAETKSSPAPSPELVELSRTTAASGGGSPGSASENPQKDGYLMAIRQAITARWQSLHPGEPLPACTLVIEQTVGGAVTGTQTGDCVVDPEQRRALEAAALMAQPLPYSGYEKSFSAELRLAF